MAEQQEDNTVYIGTKPVKTYALSVATQFQEGYDSVYLKARGNSIGRAVDVEQALVNDRVSGIDLPNDLEVANMETGTEQVEDDENGKVPVSTIEIELAG